MANEFLIRETNGAKVLREPTVGKWYAGMEPLSDGEGGEVLCAGPLGEYAGNGDFCDENEYGWGDVDMRIYTELAEQS